MKAASLAIGLYMLTAGAVLFSVSASSVVLSAPSDRPWHELSVLARCGGGDGAAYADICDTGYRYATGQKSNIAFFPAYPLCARCVRQLVPLTTVASLLVVSHVFLVAAFVIAAGYFTQRASANVATYGVAALALLPTTFFFRLAYSEAMFLCLVGLTLMGIVRRWPVALLATIVGLATATRPVGIALLVPFALYAWRRSCMARKAAESLAAHERAPATGRWTQRWLRAGPVFVFLLIACWGLIAFMCFQWTEHGNPLLFAPQQYYRGLRYSEHAAEMSKAVSLLIAEPIWSVYVPSKVEYWGRYECHDNPFISLQCANPVYFVGTVALVIVGWRQKWLNDYEIVLSAALLLIPYVTKSYDNAMASFGRFAAVVLPAYLVMGHLLARLPWPVSAAILCVGAFLLCAYSALFAAGYRLL